MSSPREEAVEQVVAEVGVLIRRARRVIAERAREVHECLQPATYLVLAHVSQHGPLRASALVGELGVDKAAVSRQVQQLIDLGLLDRAPDPHDGRATLLSVSDEGRARLEAVGRHGRKRFEDLLSGWSDDELATFATDLARYNATLEGR